MRRDQLQQAFGGQTRPPTVVAYVYNQAVLRKTFRNEPKELRNQRLRVVYVEGKDADISELAMRHADHSGAKDVRHERVRPLDAGARVRGGSYLLLGLHNVRRKQELEDLTHVLRLVGTLPPLDDCGS